jgi:hypothetical protein
MKAFFVHSPDFRRRQPTAVKGAACDTGLRTFSHGDAVRKVARVLRAGGADIIAEARPFQASLGR